MESLISGDQEVLLWAAILGVAAFGVWAEKSRIGGRISGAVIVLIVGFILGNTHVLPVVAPVYSTIFSNFVPLGIGLLLLQLDLKALRAETGPVFGIFLIGALGTGLGAVLAFQLFPLADGHAVAGMFAATYIGGSANLVAVADAYQMTESPLMVPVIASDTIVTIIYLIILGLIPAMAPLKRLFKDTRTREAKAKVAAGEGTAHWSEAPFDIGSALSALLLVTAFSAAGGYVDAHFELPGARILTVTVLALTAATLFSDQMKRIKGTFQLGMGILFIFFAALGATGDMAALIDSGLSVFLFAIVVIVVHFIVVFPAGYFMGLELSEITTASNACVCGSATAGPMAADAGWDHLVSPGILAGVFGNAIASFIGIGLAAWLV